MRVCSAFSTPSNIRTQDARGNYTRDDDDGNAGYDADDDDGDDDDDAWGCKLPVKRTRERATGHTKTTSTTKVFCAPLGLQAPKFQLRTTHA